MFSKPIFKAPAMLRLWRNWRSRGDDNNAFSFEAFRIINAMENHIAIQFRKQTWAIAVVLLGAFCYLGCVAVNCGSLWKGLESYLPAGSRFAYSCGPIVFPLF